LVVSTGWLLFVSGETWVHRMSFPVKTTESLTWCRKGLVLGLLTHFFPCLEDGLHVSFRGDRITRLFISAMKSWRKERVLPVAPNEEVAEVSRIGNV